MPTRRPPVGLASSRRSIGLGERFARSTQLRAALAIASRIASQPVINLGEAEGAVRCSPSDTREDPSRILFIPSWTTGSQFSLMCGSTPSAERLASRSGRWPRHWKTAESGIYTNPCWGILERIGLPFGKAQRRHGSGTSGASRMNPEPPLIRSSEWVGTSGSHCFALKRKRRPATDDPSSS